MPDHMTTAEVSELIRTPAETVRYWRHIGKGPRSFKVGRRVLYRRSDVDSWLEAQYAAGDQAGQ
ncbi:helix-turn-helix domain-containing protein [Nocardioides sp. Bht2]|uniref:helix-turn-helix domain-containing protein n=1 Tax=Nocardioides sp. Bht2 TaxID=3392297 RepID=UPI0039B5DE05